MRAHLCLEAHHQLTRWLVDTYGENVVEDFDIVAMKYNMGRRAVSDTQETVHLGSRCKTGALMSAVCSEAGTKHNDGGGTPQGVQTK